VKSGASWPRPRSRLRRTNRPSACARKPSAGHGFRRAGPRAPSARGYPWLVLFERPIQPEWKAALAAAGATVRAYVPDNAWLVELPAGRREAVQALPHVAWSGEYRPAHKLQPLLAGLARQHPDLPVPVTVQTFAPEDAADVAAQLAAAGGSDLRATPAKRWASCAACCPPPPPRNWPPCPKSNGSSTTKRRGSSTTSPAPPTG
jgi:hypothetical protein